MNAQALFVALQAISNLPGEAAFPTKDIAQAIRGGCNDFLFVNSNQRKLQSEQARAFGDVLPRAVIAATPGEATGGAIPPS